MPNIASDFSAKTTSETEKFNEGLRQALSVMPPVWTQSPSEGRRRSLSGGNSIFPAPIYSDRAYWRTVAGRDGPIRVRLLPPSSGVCETVYLHIHGGGWVFGSADPGEPQLEVLTNDASVMIISVEYRLAPEYPYPAAVNDCEDVACWLIDVCEREFGTDRIFIGGESAGAHLSVLTLLRLRDLHKATPFSGALLLYGCYDLTGSDSLLNWGNTNLILDTPTMRWFFDQFVPSADRSDQSISPLFADLSSMPNALFIVGSLDPLFDDTLQMAGRWQEAGNQAELAFFSGGVHAFNAFPIQIAHDANELARQFLSKAV